MKTGLLVKCEGSGRLVKCEETGRLVECEETGRLVKCEETGRLVKWIAGQSQTVPFVHRTRLVATGRCGWSQP